MTLDSADTGAEPSDRDDFIAELPESVQSGDVDTVSVRRPGRGHVDDS